MSHKLVSLYIGDGEYYTRADTDNVLAEKDAQIVSLNREIARIQDKMCEDVFEGIMPSEHIVCRPLQQAAKDIAELKAQKAQAEDDCAYWKAKAQRERHHKFKRCITLAKYCDASMAFFGEFYDDASKRMVNHYYKWRKRWYDLAEQFKEAK